MLGEILPVNAVVVVDTALDNMVANSSQFVRELFSLVNYLLGSARIEIRISDILLESSQRNYAFLLPLDEVHGLNNMHICRHQLSYGRLKKGNSIMMLSW